LDPCFLSERERKSSDTWGQGGCVFAICAANFLNNTADQNLTTENLKTSFDKNSKKISFWYWGWRKNI